MLEISTSGLMSGDVKRSKLFRAQPPRPSSTLLVPATLADRLVELAGYRIRTRRGDRGRATSLGSHRRRRQGVRPNP